MHLQLLHAFAFFKTLLHVVCRSRSGACWLITVLVFLYLWYSHVEFLTSCLLPTSLPSLFLFQLLPVSPFPRISQLACAPGRSFSPLRRHCDPMEGGEDGRRVSQPDGKGLFSHCAFDLLCGNALYQKKLTCRSWGGETGSGFRKYLALCCQRNSSQFSY